MLFLLLVFVCFLGVEPAYAQIPKYQWTIQARFQTHFCEKYIPFWEGSPEDEPYIEPVYGRPLYEYGPWDNNGITPPFISSSPPTIEFLGYDIPNHTPCPGWPNGGPTFPYFGNWLITMPSDVEDYSGPTSWVQSVDMYNPQIRLVSKQLGLADFSCEIIIPGPLPPYDFQNDLQRINNSKSRSFDVDLIGNYDIPTKPTLPLTIGGYTREINLGGLINLKYFFYSMIMWRVFFK